MFNRFPSDERPYYEALSQALNDLKDDVPFSTQIAKERNQMIEFVEKNPKSNANCYPHFDLAFYILVYVCNKDDQRIDRIEKKLIESLYLTKKRLLTDAQKKDLLQVFKKGISIDEIERFIYFRNMTPAAVLKSLDVVVQYVDLNDKYVPLMKELYTHFITIEYKERVL